MNALEQAFSLQKHLAKLLDDCYRTNLFYKINQLHWSDPNTALLSTVPRMALLGLLQVPREILVTIGRYCVQRDMVKRIEKISEAHVLKQRICFY